MTDLEPMTGSLPADAARGAVLRAESLTKHYAGAGQQSALAWQPAVASCTPSTTSASSCSPARRWLWWARAGRASRPSGRVLAHLEPPTSGKVLFKGKALNLKRRSVLRGYRAQVQLIFQDPYASSIRCTRSPTTWHVRFGSTGWLAPRRCCAPASSRC